MKIAVTYENGQIFQHFGHTEAFKVYTVAEGKIIASEVVSSNGSGHGALAGVLSGRGVDVLICGGIGGGARNALAERGIELCSGAEGDCDAAVEAYLAGTLTDAGGECTEHAGEHSCGHTCGEPCEEQPAAGFDGKNVGHTCRVHYRGTFNDGTQFDSSYDRGEPLEFVCGAGQMIAGFDAAVADMEVGEIKQIHLLPKDAYGEPDPAAIFTIELARMPGAENLTAGQRVYLQNTYGQPVPVTVTAKDDTTITFDANHEMAGKELNFSIELVTVSP